MADHMTAEQLLPCPFCGRSDALCIFWASEFSDWDGSNDDTCQVYCDASGASGPPGCGGSCGAAIDEDAARRKWNARLSGMAAVPQWQPIETAPKDGTEVLLVNRNGNRASGLWQGTNQSQGWWTRGGSGPNVFFNEPYGPTHWMPLPAPPEPPHG